MKLNNLTPIVLSAAALCAGSLSLSAATSGVVGATSITVPSGPTVMSIAYLKSVELQSAVASVTGADVDVGATVPVLTGPHYLHVLDGTDAGRVYDIDSYVGNVVTLTGAPVALTAGDTVAIRAHMTLDDLGASVPNFSTVTLLEPGGTPLVATKLFTGWSTGGDTIIRPAEGFVINNGLAFTMTLSGAVSEDDVIYEAASGPAIIGFIDPVDGAVDVVSTVAAGVPNFSTITALNPDGSPLVSTKLFTGWSIDPSTIDVTDYKSIVINTAAGVNIVNAGNVIAP
ncbi:hypothetical protein G0Q06_04825 [Puniceicoccales bacterium CK1056]|uniref:DUF4397 domain-containing protein n=1 Tax=Oceanipulchritudo coccoides TaxID=2706888 RepID=A0A6B2M136_9BACT|nr:hypothetical protein [Oceanipulchritudo coccoides]NDV61767.1 hypothetical protein [Oceanipulchritudo coccoides]